VKNLASLSDLNEELKARYSPVWTELETFDSAAQMLRIHYQDRYFVIAMTAPNSVCLDEPRDDDGLTSSFRHRFENLALASEALWRMMSSEKDREEENQKKTCHIRLRV
jgi:hypothetical protein